ncbi:reverse transcriptase domain-containing protein [Tanacetum coccineum]
MTGALLTMNLNNMSLHFVRSCERLLKGSLKWMDTEVASFAAKHQASKRYKTYGSSSFNTESGDASINMNVDVGNEQEDEVQELLRSIGRDKVKGLKKKGSRSSGSSSSMNDEALDREVEYRERELAMQEYKQRQEYIRFYMQPYDHLTGDALNHMEAIRAEIKAKWKLPYTHLKSAITHLNLNDHSLHLKMILENVNNNVGELVGGTGGRADRGGGRTRGRSGDQGDGRIDGQGGQVSGQGSEVDDGVNGVPDFSTIIAQQLHNLLPTIVTHVGDQGKDQGNGRNENGDVANDNIRGDVSRGCTYKEFLACNPKEYDGKGGMSWEDFKTLTREEFCPSNEMQKLETELWNHTMVRAGHVAHTDRFHDLARLVPHLVTPEGKRIERYMYGLALQIHVGRNGSIKKNPKKRGNGGEPSKDRNVRDDNKRTRTGNAFATTTNPVGRENTGTVPKCTTCNTHHSPETPCHTCFNCNNPRDFAKDCRVVPRNVNPINAINPNVRACYVCGITDHVKTVCPRLNRAQGPGGNRPNHVLANNGDQGRGNQGNQARGRAFMLVAEEARQDPNIVTGTFTLNDHYATTLFDSGADYSFVSITFIPLLGIEPSDLGFSYEIEIASGFDVIIGMDWLSNHKAEIICQEKVVRIPLLDGKVLRVLGEKPEEKVRQLMSANAKEKKQEEVVVVKDFPEVFPDDLSRLPPVREIEFRIELVPGAMLVAKSPYHLTPSELEELSGQLKEL